MNMIYISDVTMKQSGKASGVNLSFREKIELAKQLDRLGVNVIETSPIVNPKVDALLIKSISTAVKRSVVAVPTDLEEGSALTLEIELQNCSKNAYKIPVEETVPAAGVTFAEPHAGIPFAADRDCIPPGFVLI